jgi:hypothetical protein
MRSQLLCLSDYLGQNAAARTAYLSAALSRACHYHSYELASPHRDRTDPLARRDHPAHHPPAGKHQRVSGQRRHESMNVP